MSSFNSNSKLSIVIFELPRAFFVTVISRRSASCLTIPSELTKVNIFPTHPFPFLLLASSIRVQHRQHPILRFSVNESFTNFYDSQEGRSFGCESKRVMRFYDFSLSMSRSSMLKTVSIIRVIFSAEQPEYVKPRSQTH